MKLNVSSDCRAWVFYPIFSFSLAFGIPGSLDVLKKQYLFFKGKSKLVLSEV